ncbi:type III-B CRISPR module RAMP protein Cmr1 [Clostridium sporogenes]|uniref:type III-B CRISPR module RAMP protein Cmr1 n=1 Tax=Clostridium sporogenes TaxID=1509 RepID=UPI0013D0F83E|nr:type III-B CRISPR module RAMP protein Cmr1 [Clostridium botulinum]NFV11642.1 type III-B CRISPR module RAMP protein Cmr1 [Clostridium sporogenes]
MKRVKVTLEVLTPMLSFGDDSRISEFRITELKFLMRNTFRELYYFKDAKDMKAKEDMLFGNIHRKSPICFKVTKVDPKGEEKVFMLPHKKVRPGKEEKKEKSEVSCLGASSEISLYMIMNNILNIDLYVILLIQASIIGGLGKRSRKGFGSFRVIDIDGIENDKFKSILRKSPIEILRECSEWADCNIRSLYPIRNLKNDSKQIEKLDFDYPYAKKIEILKISKNKNYKSLIESISKLTHCRLCNKKDCNKDFVYKIENSNQINRNILGNCRGQEVKINRFASPISVSFWENSNNKYMIIKQLNYNYILGRLRIQDNGSIKANEDYINKYIKELVKIGDGEK